MKKFIYILLSLIILCGCSDNNETDKEATTQQTSITSEEVESSPYGYFSTGDTPLKITKVEVYNSDFPGQKDAYEFRPGSTMFITVWCENEPRNNSKSYLVLSECEHSPTYPSNISECTEDMFFYYESIPGQFSYELTIPDDIIPGKYELRFVCDEVEEGYFSFMIK